jgi:tetratricopeptide (TPR) repeat protein
VSGEHRDERPERPTWASLPTMPWSRVPATERPEVPADQDDDEDSGERGRSSDEELDEYGESGIRRRPVEGHVVGRRSPDEPAVEYRRADGEPLSSRRATDTETARGSYRTARRGTGDDPPSAATYQAAGYPTGSPVSPVTGSATAPRPGAAGHAIPDNADPESLLTEVRVQYDPESLFEFTDNPEQLMRIRDLLTTKINTASDNPTRARLLGLRAVASRILGDLRPAQADAKMALVHAEATGQLRRVAVAQARLANIMVRVGEYVEADRLFALANSNELPERLRAAIHHYAGKCAFGQDRYIEACQHFEKALELRRDGDPELVTATEVALDALFSRVAARGWGPYPRARDEILQPHRPPEPAFDQHYDRWGYTDEYGGWPIAPQFADVQPFRDGVAWVRPVGIETWGLIDEAGRLYIDPRAGFLGVSSFADGAAWVSRDGLGGWFAIDKSGRVLIQAGFDDVRPFRRGIAIVRNGGKWGAVEKNGRLAVPFAFDAFATGLTDGRYVEGFTDEGLAIVEINGRKGVVDRTGRAIVPCGYPTIVIHPVAFLYTDANHRWGALDRSGQPLVNPTHASRSGVSDELEQLLTDTRPML